MNIYYKALSLLTLLITSLITCNCFAEFSHDSYPYGKKIRYIDHQVIELPDISIRFLGSISDSSPSCPTDCAEYDFVVTRGKEEKGISWSSERNDIKPRYFEIGGEEYVLELGGSLVDSFTEEGKMGWHEMIVWKKDEYERRRNEKQREKEAASRLLI